MVSDSLEWAHRFNSHHIRIPICSTSLFRKQERDKIQNMAMLQFVQSVFRFDKILFRPTFDLRSPLSVVGRFHESLNRRHLPIYSIIGQGKSSCHTSNPPGSIKGRNLSCSGLNFSSLPFWSTQNLDEFVVTLFCDWPMTAPTISMYCIFAESKRRKSKIWGKLLIQIYIREGTKKCFFTFSKKTETPPSPFFDHLSFIW